MLAWKESVWEQANFDRPIISESDCSSVIAALRRASCSSMSHLGVIYSDVLPEALKLRDCRFVHIKIDQNRVAHEIATYFHQAGK